MGCFIALFYLLMVLVAATVAFYAWAAFIGFCVVWFIVVGGIYLISKLVTKGEDQWRIPPQEHD